LLKENIKPDVSLGRQFSQKDFLKMARKIVFTASLRKEVCHEGTKARSRKMLRIFLCVFESLWLHSIL